MPCVKPIERGESSTNGGRNRLRGTKKKKKKERERERENKKKEKEKEESRRASSPDLYHSDGWNLSDQEVKSVYSTRVTLQEVAILPNLVISTLRVVWLCFLA